MKPIKCKCKGCLVSNFHFNVELRSPFRLDGLMNQPIRQILAVLVPNRWFFCVERGFRRNYCSEMGENENCQLVSVCVHVCVRLCVCGVRKTCVRGDHLLLGTKKHLYREYSSLETKKEHETKLYLWSHVSLNGFWVSTVFSAYVCAVSFTRALVQATERLRDPLLHLHILRFVAQRGSRGRAFEFP